MKIFLALLFLISLNDIKAQSLENVLMESHLPVNSMDMSSISSSFGMRSHPIKKKLCLHNGVDIKIAYKPCLSILLGKVLEVGYNRTSGNYIVIKHLNGLSCGYAHLQEIFVSKGEIVRAGTIIGITGNTGSSTGPHLHFTLKYKGKPIDPLPLLMKIKTMNF